MSVVRGSSSISGVEIRCNWKNGFVSNQFPRVVTEMECARAFLVSAGVGDAFVHNIFFHNVGRMDFPSIANLFVGCCFFVSCVCSHFPNDDIAMRSDS